MRRALTLLVLLSAMAAPLAGCVVVAPPPRPGPYAHWVPGHYQGWHWVGGHWG
jgi:hypothetical protein